MTVLVTGANGGFGKVFLPWLRRNYSELVIGSVRTNTSDENSIVCDLLDEFAIISLIEKIKPRIIFHLAGSFTGDFKKDMQINAISAMHIFECIAANKLKTRVVILGSAAEYGLVVPSDNPISESFYCKPVSVYGVTKLMQTEISSYFANQIGVDIVIARIFNLATPGLSTRLFYGRAEEQIIAYVNGEINSFKFGNLDSVRDYIEFSEAALQLKAIADYGISGEIYNVGSGIPKKIRDVLKVMFITAGIDNVEIEESDSINKSVGGRDVPMIYADMTKLKSLMNVSLNAK